MKKNLASQLYDFLYRNEILDDNQSAYRKCFSVETALLATREKILSSLMERKVILLVSLDLSAAFDTIPHEKLTRVLNAYAGISGQALTLIEDYLAGRKQMVFISGKCSHPQSVNIGVPQGSLMGPLLFILYMLPLKYHLESQNIFYQSYADDTVLLFEVTDNIDSKTAVENKLHYISGWFEQHGLKLNHDKTEIMFIQSKRQAKKISFNVEFENMVIKPKEVIKTLGVFFDRNFDMKANVGNTCRTCYFNLKKLYAIRRYLDFDNRHLLARIFILNRLDYCNSMIVGYPQYLQRRLQKVQNSAARFIYGCYRGEHITPYLHDLHWLPIACRISFKVACWVYRCLNTNDLPKWMSQIFMGRFVQSKRVSCSLILSTTKVKCNYGTQTLNYTGVKLWNGLPIDLRSSSSFDMFRKRLKTVLFQRHYYQTE